MSRRGGGAIVLEGPRLRTLPATAFAYPASATEPAGSKPCSQPAEGRRARRRGLENRSMISARGVRDSSVQVAEVGGVGRRGAQAGHDRARSARRSRRSRRRSPSRGTPAAASASATTTPVRSLPAAQWTSTAPSARRDVLERADDRVRAVAQVAQVDADGGLLAVGRARSIDVGQLALLGIERAVADLDAPVATSGPGPSSSTSSPVRRSTTTRTPSSSSSRRRRAAVSPCRLSERSSTPGRGRPAARRPAGLRGRGR